MSGEAAHHCLQPGAEEAACTVRAGTGEAVHNHSNLKLEKLTSPYYQSWVVRTRALQEPGANDDFRAKGTRYWRSCTRSMPRKHARARKENLSVHSVSPVPSTGKA